MTVRREFIRKKAQQAREELLQHRYDDRWSAPPSDPYAIEPEKIIQLRGVTFLEPVEIHLQNDVAEYDIAPRYAGYMDPGRNVIAVARNLSLEVRRFTIAHELGHHALHREKGILFRDLPLSGAELDDQGRNPEEREADFFSADLLMPDDLVRRAFLLYFGTDSLVSERMDERAAGFLTTPQRRVTAAELRQKGRRFCSLLLAHSRPWSFDGGLDVLFPLCNLFRVSKTAMAIQLESLRLVV